MQNQIARKILFSLSDLLETGTKKLRGAANRISSQTSLTILDCESANWKNVKPCFVLSTGRSGTLILNKLLQQSKNAYPVHAPKPELIRASKRAYEKIHTSAEIFSETFKSAREELVYEAAVRDKIFIETNNRITFFCPIIRNVFPNSVFIHLVRHPADFVRSGIRRNWYSGKQDHDLGRIVPIKGEQKKQWKKFSIIQKIGWLWNETNQFIEDFKSSLKKDLYICVKAEELFVEPTVTEEIYSFLNLGDYNGKRVKNILKTPVNVQKKGTFPEYINWTKSEIGQLKSVITLSSKYTYKLQDF